MGANAMNIAVQKSVGLALGAVLLLTSSAYGQITEDWALFSDSQSDTECDIVNGSNTEFVVLFDSGNLATVAGVTLVDLFVDINNPALPVTFAGEPAGFLDFQLDADGLPTLFWLSLSNTVVGIDTFTSEPFDSNLFPEEIANTGCDACEVIDSPLCDGTGGGGGGDGGVDIPIDLGDLCGVGGLEGTAAAALLLIPITRRRRKSQPRRK
jgi:hypothetical protein